VARLLRSITAANRWFCWGYETSRLRKAAVPRTRTSELLRRQLFTYLDGPHLVQPKIVYKLRLRRASGAKMDHINSLFAVFMTPLMTGIAFFVTSLSVVFAIVFYIKQKRVRAPRYSISDTQIIDRYTSQFPGLDVLFNGTKVKTVAVTRFYFWNSGAETIRANDVAPANPLRIEPRAGTTFLAANLVYANRPENNFRLELADESIHIAFDYVDRGEGCLIEVLRTGEADARPVLSGTVLGVPAIKGETVRWDVPTLIGLFVMPILMTTIFILGILQFFFDEERPPRIFTTFDLYGLAIVGALAVTLIAGIVIYRRLAPRFPDLLQRHRKSSLAASQ
jgi:hypothetical protein